VFARLFFRAGDLEPAGAYLSAIGRMQWLGDGLDPMVVALCALTLWMNFKGGALRERFIAWHSRVPGLARPGVWLAIAAVLLALTPSGVPPYIYFGF
jgi:hypothetical protein